MRYFEYISANKLELLKEQLRRSPVEVQAKAGVNVGLISGEVSIRHAAHTEQVASLAAVEKMLHKSGQVGSVDDDREWVASRSSAQLAYFPERPELLFWFGSSELTDWAMGGSSSNLSGGHDTGQARGGQSHLPSLLNGLHDYVALANGRVTATETSTATLSSWVASGSAAWSDVISGAMDSIPGTEVEVEFLAKVLLRAGPPVPAAKRTLLLSPLYVAI